MHPTENQTVVGESIYVSANWTVDEGQEDVIGYLFGFDGLHQVRADPPVLLGRLHDLVVDPATARRLDERVVQEARKSATVDQYPGYLGHSFVHRLDVLEHQTCHHGIE